MSSAHPAPEVARVVSATGLGWDTIVDHFEAAGGAEASHAELAAAVHPLMVKAGVENPGWWGQGATIAYEKQIGRRVTGQSGRGDFQVAASRTVRREGAGGRDRAALRDDVGAAVTAGTSESVRVADIPRVSDTPKRSYWRCSLEGGQALQVAVETKDPARLTVTLTVTGMGTAEEREPVRAALKGILGGL
ncbi:hypothetical protein AALF15_02930 [Corynebacteriaceae bacterium 7-707]